MVIVAATVVAITAMNINITVDVHIGVTVYISVAVYVGVPIDVSAIIDIGISVEISATINIAAAINVGPRSTPYLPGLCILGQHPAGSDDKTPDCDQGYKPGV